MLNPNFEPHPPPRDREGEKKGREEGSYTEPGNQRLCEVSRPPFLEEEIVLLQGCGEQFGLDGRGMYGKSDATCTQGASYASEG